ncbi:NADH-ubiquinone reductase complex 1 MLRQ subunit-domain-containing protein [Spinellus fusiger]|nr:NADH-ubiquinone reductase complex 1 MLRQ subunit-domain-containing protein [Spinellus fusiger]
MGRQPFVLGKCIKSALFFPAFLTAFLTALQVAMGFSTFLKLNPALVPLFVFAGGGCIAAVSYPLYLLRTHPEIQVDKKNNPYPWQHVQQNRNIKLFSSHPEIYSSRSISERPY